MKALYSLPKKLFLESAAESVSPGVGWPQEFGGKPGGENTLTVCRHNVSWFGLSPAQWLPGRQTVLSGRRFSGHFIA
jgi:hypothetical protein